MNMTRDEYQSLHEVLESAYNQAAFGKGRERHASDAADTFEDQITCWMQRRGFDFCRGQAVKKIDESLRLEREAAIRELLGAINYIAAAIITLRNADG